MTTEIKEEQVKELIKEQNYLQLLKYDQFINERETFETSRHKKKLKSKHTFKRYFPIVRRSFHYLSTHL